jgi:outer membrane immunogenic protein
LSRHHALVVVACHRLLLAGVTLAMLAAGPAAAADMPVVYKAPPPRAATWSGLYAGLNGGYVWQNARSVSFTGNDDLMRGIIAGTSFTDPSETPPSLVNLRPHGFTGGGQVGLNWQVAPQWLIGLEADVNAAGVRDTGATSFVLVTPQTATITARQELSWYGTARARAGFLPAENLLLFGTAGLAFGQIKERSTFATSQLAQISSSGGGQFTCPGGFAICFVGTSTRTAVGGAVGAGAEYAVNRVLTFKVEYLYVNLGGRHVVDTVAFGGVGSTASFNANFGRVDFSTIRVGVNVRLGEPPLAARY